MTKITEWNLVNLHFFDKQTRTGNSFFLRRDANGMGNTVQNKLNIMRKIQVSAAQQESDLKTEI